MSEEHEEFPCKVWKTSLYVGNIIDNHFEYEEDAARKSHICPLQYICTILSGLSDTAICSQNQS